MSPWRQIDAQLSKLIRTQRGTFVLGETRPQGSLPPPRPPPVTRGENTGAIFVFGAGHPPAQQITTTAHARPPTRLPLLDSQGENASRPFVFCVGQAVPHGAAQPLAPARPPQLKRTTETLAKQKERLPQEPPPPAKPPPAASFYSVTVRGPNRDVTKYKIKKYAKMGEIFMYHVHAGSRSQTSCNSSLMENALATTRHPARRALQ